ncbi:hypothetical protein ACFWE5_05470 [Cellulosimicrobium funkei]|uniref:hypothetical protein n=1 Tax=Cellulosimicrobium funkei TaxID=264251 RepID=UPI003655F976
MSRWGHARRRALCAALLLAVPATLVGSTASADLPATVPPPRFAAYSPVTPGTSCVPDDVPGVVNAIAWEEIERLGARGLPVCDVRWRFVPGGVGWWGFADAVVRPGEAPRVWIVEDVAAYGDDGDAVDGELLEQHVRTTVRHELGHVLDALLGLSEDDLRDLVVVELDRERPTLRPAREAFAEAVTVALTPDGEERTWFYDEHVPEENVRGAELVIEAFTSDRQEREPRAVDGSQGPAHRP